MDYIFYFSSNYVLIYMLLLLEISPAEKETRINVTVPRKSYEPTLACKDYIWISSFLCHKK